MSDDLSEQICNARPELQVDQTHPACQCYCADFGHYG